MPESVDHPEHYTFAPGYEVVDVISAWGLNFALGSVVKYVARHRHKGNATEDLKKARWFLDYEISRRMEKAT